MEVGMEVEMEIRANVEMEVREGGGGDGKSKRSIYDGRQKLRYHDRAQVSEHGLPLPPSARG